MVYAFRNEDANEGGRSSILCCTTEPNPPPTRLNVTTTILLCNEKTLEEIFIFESLKSHLWEKTTVKGRQL